MMTITTPFETLLKGLEEVTEQQRFCQESCKFLEETFERIFAIASTIKWKRTPRGLEGAREVCGEVKVKNYAEEEITLPVFLSITDGRRSRQIVCLRLGGQNGPPIISAT